MQGFEGSHKHTCAQFVPCKVCKENKGEPRSHERNRASMLVINVKNVFKGYSCNI